MCSYLTDDKNENKKPKGTKNCAMKRKLKFEYYKYFLEATYLENKVKQPEKNQQKRKRKENHKEFIKE